MTRIGYPLPSSLDKDYRFIMDNSFALPLQFEVRTVSHFNTLKNHVGVRERSRIRKFSSCYLLLLVCFTTTIALLISYPYPFSMIMIPCF